MSSEVLSLCVRAMLTGAVACPAAMQPSGQLATRMRNRFLSDPLEGMDQILVWLAIDGLFLWQFMGIIDRDDPMIAQIGTTLRARIKATLENASSTATSMQMASTRDVNHAAGSQA